MRTEEMSVEQLIELAHQDATWLGKLLQRYHGYLLLEGQQRIGAKLAVYCDPADAVQETFARALRGFARFKGTTESQLTCWLRRIFENYVTDVLRKATRRSEALEMAGPMGPSDGSASIIWTELAADELTPSQYFIRGEKALRVAELLQSLPADQRDAVHFRHLMGWPLKKIAEHMGVTESAVAGLLYRALNKLRRTMSCESWF